MPKPGDSPTTHIGDLEFAAIDFESAGAVRGATDVPVQIGIAVSRRLVFSPDDSFVSYLAAPTGVHWSVRKIHGISDDDIADAPALRDVWPEVRERMRGRVIVAHGAGTEKRFLRAFPGHGFGPWIDTLELYRKVLPDAEVHTLGYLCRICGLESECLRIVPDFRWHDAYSDAVACLLLLHHYIRQADLGAASIHRLIP